MAWKLLVRKSKRFIDKVINPFPPEEKIIFPFTSTEALREWKVTTDKEYGGKTTAELELREGHACFSGDFSTEVADENSRLRRSGFASIRSLEDPAYIDLEGFDTLAFRVRGDGRKYLATLRTDNWIVGDQSEDLWQAFLFARAGVWQEVEIPLSRFLLTHRGRLVEEAQEINQDAVLSLGISIAGQQAPGPFSLGLEWVKARQVHIGFRRR